MTDRAPKRMSEGDHLQRLLLEQANARCVVAHLDETYAQVRSRGQYPDRIAQLIGETLVVCALCSSGVKFDGRISLQLRSSSALKLLMADCTDQGGLRGLARFEPSEALASADFSTLTDGGILTMTVEPSTRGHDRGDNRGENRGDNRRDKRGQMWQGIVPLEGGSMARAIERYFEQSEQLETKLVLAVNETRASGILLQRMPGPTIDDDGWDRVCALLDTLEPQELLATDSETLLHRLFHEESRRLFPSRPLEFFCPCSRERVATVLRGLGAEELESIVAARGEIDVSCEFCNQQYSFDRLDVTQLLHSDAPDAPDGGSTVH